MSANLNVQLNTRVVSLKAAGEAFTLRSKDGKTLTAGTVVVTAPVEQTSDLLRKLRDDSEELRSVRTLLDMIRSEPCLTLLAGYSLDGPAPPWDVCYPEDSQVFVLMSHDSAKRRHKSFHTLVYQGRPRWSRERLERDPDSWSREALDEAGRLIGPWAREPQWAQCHRWKYARVDPASALASPVLMEIESGLRLGLAGEVFAYSGGIEAAWLSGRRLAERILGDRKA
jgi:predicted NAD/FAD-dependent oxidoreductase